jgi:hypothetical protein
VIISLSLSFVNHHLAVGRFCQSLALKIQFSHHDIIVKKRQPSIQIVCQNESDESCPRRTSWKEPSQDVRVSPVAAFALCSTHNFINQTHFTPIQHKINMNFSGRYQPSGPSPFPVAKDQDEPSLPMRRKLGLRSQPNKNENKRRSSVTKRTQWSNRSTHSGSKH